MPAGFASGLHSIVFRYVTVAQVRAAGISDKGPCGISDARLNQLIPEMGLWINRLTDQWFLPYRLVEKVDGHRSSIARIPNQIPILDFFDLRLEKNGLFNFSFPNVSYQVKQRYVMMLTQHIRLPIFPHFVIMDGVFGWLNDDYRKVPTTTTAPISIGDTSISVASVAGMRLGDTVLIGRDVEPGSFPIVITSIDSILNVLGCEPVPFALPSPVPAVRYGIIPPLIQRAVYLLLRDHSQRIGDRDRNSTIHGIGTRLNNESVEGYSYGLSAMPSINGFAGGSWTTGNVEVDDILQQFCTPAMYVGTV